MPSQHRSVTLETSPSRNDPDSNPQLKGQTRISAPSFHQFFSSTKLPSAFLFLSYYTTLHYTTLHYTTLHCQHHQIAHQPLGTIYPSRHLPPTIAFPRILIVALPNKHHLYWTNQPRLSPWLALGSTSRPNTPCLGKYSFQRGDTQETPHPSAHPLPQALSTPGSSEYSTVLGIRTYRQNTQVLAAHRQPVITYPI